MSAVGTLIGLALATTAVVVISVINGKSVVDWFSQENTVKSDEEWIDPNGPKVQFVLFTREYPPFNIIIGNDTQFLQAGLNLSNPTKIIVHGYLSNIKGDVFTLTKDAYLETGDYNVIGMDWSTFCKFEYTIAMNGAKIAGHYLGGFLNWLEQMGVPLERIHIIGHSLGAHLAGIAAGDVKKGKIGRITGLDPAKPGFKNTKDENKLDTQDALLVDVVHTYVRFLSLDSPVGHIDFYPNGGRYQPGCPTLADVLKIAESLVCNHGRSFRLFAESIRNKHSFRSLKCKSILEAFDEKCTQETNVYMGQAETYVNGIYYFKTRDTEPYSLPELENVLV